MRFGPGILFPGILLANLALVVAVSAVSTQGTLASETQIQATPTPLIHQEALISPPSRAKECNLAAGYPEKILRWCNLITRYAEENGLPPNLVAAVILVESAGDPNAYSRSGAVGLMQVMPRDGLATAFQCQNGPCFSSRPSTEELFDPEFNIRYGTRLLASYLQRYGDLRQALKAYGPMNAGYSYADKVLQIYHQHDDE